MSPRLRRLLALSLGLLLALPVLEGVFRLRDDGAFPHLNLYVADEELGARLLPNTEMRLSFSGNPTTTVRTNAQGFRGADWPEEAEVLVVGDSQVFGLGVEEEQTFSAVLAERTGKTVLNGGLPTYGPREYTAVVGEVLATREVKTVVWVVNLANDLFESERPNTERHAVWDGWAVRIENAPAEAPLAFPGRDWLFRRSHLVFALRRLFADETETGPVPSEGSWEDLLQVGGQAQSAHGEAEQAFEGQRSGLQTRLAELDAEREAAQKSIDQQLLESTMLGYGDEVQVQAAEGRPGDIVRNYYAESSREIPLTVQHIRIAAQQKRRWEQQLRTARAREELGRRAELDETRRELRRTVLLPPPVGSVLAGPLAEVKALCEAHGAELVVVVLPLDVQVSPGEWDKYGVTDKPDMSETLLLNADVVQDVERLGVRALDPLPALREASPGAFLDGDLHMSPSGHAALAEALAATLAGPPPVLPPAPGIPEHRSPIPEPWEWDRAPEIVVRGSSAAHCWTLRIDEWLRVTCLDEAGLHPSGIEVAHPEARVVVTDFAATLVVPALAPLTATFHWTDHSRVLHVEEPRSWFDAPAGPGRPSAVSEADEALCKCHMAVLQEEICEPFDPEEYDAEPACEASCATLYGSPDEACDYQFCEARLLCARGDPLAPPTCARQEANVLGRCRPLCDEAHPCAEGSCTPWMGSGVCL